MRNDVKPFVTGTAILVALAALAGCASQTMTAIPPVQGTPAMNEAAKSVISGKVVETMNAGGYTYINLEKDGKTRWVAVPTMDVKVGDELELMPGAEMGPFMSKSLNRSFEKIIFSGGPVVKPSGQSPSLPPGHPTMPATPGQKQSPSSAGTMAAGKPFYAGKIVETMSSGGYTYICLEKDGKTSWAAVPPTEVKLGDTIELLPGTEMGMFRSKTLNRTFDNIIFSPGIAPKK